MSGITPAAFISKWRHVQLTERSASQQHFLDLCEVLEHPKPAEADASGEWLTFEHGADKRGGGWADVWKPEFFGWEYKGKRKHLARFKGISKRFTALRSRPRRSLLSPTPSLVINDRGELLGCYLIPGNVDDRRPVPHLVRALSGKLFGDKGYSSRPLGTLLSAQGLQLVTKLKKKNMKNRFLPLCDKLRLRKRALIEMVKTS